MYLLEKSSLTPIRHDWLPLAYLSRSLEDLLARRLELGRDIIQRDFHQDIHDDARDTR